MDIRYWALGLMLALLGSVAHADDNRGWYAGSGAGLYYIDLDGIDFDESAATLRVFGGWKMNDYVSFEAGYTNLFESSASAGVPGLTVDADIDGSSLDLTVRPTWPLNDKFELFGVAGWSRFDIETSVSGLGITVSDSETETELIYGVGGMFHLTDNWSLRGEWVTVDVSDADFSMLSVSATYKFR